MTHHCFCLIVTFYIHFFPLIRCTYEAVFFLFFLTAGCHDVNVSLGLGSGNAGRRDSFDRNTSAFSPSMDYARHKWPQYGTLGAYFLTRFFYRPPPYLDPVIIWRILSFSPLYYSVAKSSGSCVGIFNSSSGYGVRVQFTTGPYGLGQQRQQRFDERCTGCRSHVQIQG